MIEEGILRLAGYAAQLRRVPRMGWLERGVGPCDAESVAEHGFGVAFWAMLIADQASPPVDMGHVLRLALLHDLAEAILGDISATSAALLGSAAKRAAERRALDVILQGLPLQASYVEAWEEYNAAESIEARIVKDADRLDLLLTALRYEASGQQGLNDFWDRSHPDQFYTDVGRDLFRALRAERKAQT
ncbi:MAG: HD domain-containing protein [Anaerolineales bacterium]|nr:HD domain-containing protein [Anaerolineales bacterium]